MDGDPVALDFGDARQLGVVGVLVQLGRDGLGQADLAQQGEVDLYHGVCFPVGEQNPSRRCGKERIRESQLRVSARINTMTEGVPGNQAADRRARSKVRMKGLLWINGEF